MIVIVIMGVIYTLSVKNFPSSEEAKAQGVTLLTLKEYLSALEYEKSARLLCLEDCETCEIFIDGETNSTIEDFIDDSVVVYRYDYLQGAQEIVQDVYFNEDDVQKSVCFSYSVDKQGVGDQVLVKYRDAVYDFTHYIEPTQKYISLEEAINAKEKLIEEVKK